MQKELQKYFSEVRALQLKLLEAGVIKFGDSVYFLFASELFDIEKMLLKVPQELKKEK